MQEVLQPCALEVNAIPLYAANSASAALYCSANVKVLAETVPILPSGTKDAIPIALR